MPAHGHSDDLLESSAMDVSRIIESLNDAQREAVCAPPDPLLVLAGAGSGKTRVLVHRIAWLIDVEGLSPYAVLAVTFTNKAAGEMRARIEAMINAPASGMWVGTFHGLAHRLLRRHWQEAGLPQAFQILDAQDQYRLIRRVLKSLASSRSRDFSTRRMRRYWSWASRIWKACGSPASCQWVRSSRCARP